MPSESSSDNFHAVLDDLAEQTFAEGKIGVRLLQEREVTGLDPARVLLAHAPDLVACHCDSVVFCDSCDDFVLLGLVVQNGRFLLVFVDELLAEEGVPAPDYDWEGVDFGEAAANQLADEHHRPIADSRVPGLFKLPTVGHLDVLGKQILLGDSDTSDEHVAVLLGVEADLGTNVSALNTWQPVIVVVFDSEQEWVDSMVFAFYQSLCEDDCVIGEE